MPANHRSAALLLAALAAVPCFAQSFVLSTNMTPSASNVFADSTGVYIPCRVLEPGSNPARFLPVLHFDGKTFGSLGSAQIAASRIPAGGYSVARGTDGTLYLRGRFDVDQWPTSCLARKSGDSWKLISVDDANVSELVAVGDRVFLVGNRPKGQGKSASGLFAIRADGTGLEDLALVSMQGRKAHDGAVNDASAVGPALYVAGHFNSVAGVPCRDIARFENGRWSAIEPPYPAPKPDALGASGEPLGTSNAITATPAGQVFWVGSHRKLFGYNDRAIAVHENGQWRVLGKIEDDRGQLHTIRLVSSGNEVFALGSFDTLLGEKCDGFAKWNGSRFVAAGKQTGIWSTPAAPESGPMQPWPVRDRQMIEVTAGWPGKLVVLGQSELPRKSSPLAIFDVASGSWTEIRADLTP